MKHPPLIFEYSKITDYIYLGTNRCCQGHFEKSLLKKRIHADISLEDKQLDQPFGVDYYLWIPTKDHTAPSLKQLKIGVNFLNDLVNKKIKTYVHCQRGHGRAPTLVASYLVSTGISVEEALRHIKLRRPAVHPNNKQIQAVRSFARAISRC